VWPLSAWTRRGAARPEADGNAIEQADDGAQDLGLFRKETEEATKTKKAQEMIL